jgi:hypothetical protein
MQWKVAVYIGDFGKMYKQEYISYGNFTTGSPLKTERL